MTATPTPSSEALFRYLIAAEAEARMLAGEERADVVRALAARDHRCFDGSIRRVSERSIYRWILAHALEGAAGLERKPRVVAASAVLTKEFVAFLVGQKQHDEEASIPEVIRRARQSGILKPDEKVSRSTVYRACKRLGLPVARRKRAKDRDSRRFAYPHRMDMVLCDGKYFRAGAKRAKRVVLFFLDDATRYVLHAVVGTTETKELFLRGVYELIVKHGYFGAFYLDRGPGFIAEDTAAVFAQLQRPILHGESGYKEGRGKIERFNRTAKADVLRGLDGRADIDVAPGALELRLRHYTEVDYAHRPHESLDGATPWQRFSGDPKPLRFPEDEQALRRKFEVWVERRVANDHVVQLDSIRYEVPRGYAGRRVVLRRRVLEGSVGFLHEGRLIDLHPVDLASNARAPRSRPDDQQRSDQVPPVTAAELSFQRDFGAVVDDDGGFDAPDTVSHDEQTTDPR